MTPPPAQPQSGAAETPPPAQRLGSTAKTSHPAQLRSGAAETPRPARQRGVFVIAKDPFSKFNTNFFFIKELPFRGVSLALGLLTVAWPLAWAPGWAYAVAGAGAAAVLAAALTGWRPGSALAVATAIFSCAFSRAGIPVLTAEGLFILVYLLSSGAPVGLTQPGQWLRQQARLCAAGVIASGAVLGALALHSAASAWLTIVGLVAAVAAYLVALPSLRAGRRSPRE
jgi:hypothetical protein